MLGNLLARDQVSSLRGSNDFPKHPKKESLIEEGSGRFLLIFIRRAGARECLVRIDGFKLVFHQSMEDVSD